MALHTIDIKKEILINKMYVGEYLNNNIGHEVINLLRADGNTDKFGDGQNYIYVQPYGTMEKEHNEKIDTIILVRNTGIPETLEVLAQAWELEQISKIENSSRKKEIEIINIQQKKYIEEHNVKYSNRSPLEIFSDNQTDIKTAYVSFKAGKLRRPKNPLFISFKCSSNSSKLSSINGKDSNIVYLNCSDNQVDNSSDIIPKVDMAKASLKMYIRNGEVKCNKNKTYKNRKYVNQKFAFNQLKAMLENEELWEEVNTTQSADKIDIDYKNKYNFIDLIDKQYAEVTYSNLFKHILESNPELCSKFANEILKLNLSQKFEIKREEAHIDLLIDDKDNNNIVVIENKIKSSINGLKYDIYGEEVSNQLLAYYKYVNNEEKYRQRNCCFYIFAPDYNHIDTSKIKNLPNIYKLIPYSQIYEFFNLPEICNKYSSQIPYYNEFLYALSKHIHNTDNSLEIEMHLRFAKKIKNTKC